MTEKEQKDHIQLLYHELNKPEFSTIRKELELYKKSLENHILQLHVEKEEERMEHIRYTAKLEFVNMWLEMPEKIRTILDRLREAITFPG